MCGLVPLPSDALVTPVTFRVRQRNLRGILAPFDAAETGLRELSGEWVVGRNTWQRLQSECKTSKNASERFSMSGSERVILYIHGGMTNILHSLEPLRKPALGAYYFSSAAAQRSISVPLARYVDARIFGEQGFDFIFFSLLLMPDYSHRLPSCAGDTISWSPSGHSLRLLAALRRFSNSTRQHHY